MRIDLPLCGLKPCRYCFDGNCTKKSEYDRCEYQAYRTLGTVEELTALVEARDDGRLVVLPCKVGDWLYYALDDKVKKAKVEEMQCSANKHNPQFDVTVFAWDFVEKAQLTFCPAGDSWTDNSKGFVRVFLTHDEAEAALSGGGDRKDGEN